MEEMALLIDILILFNQMMQSSFDKRLYLSNKSLSTLVRVDPTSIPDADKLGFNLLAEDVGLEFDNLMDDFSVLLTSGGQECGVRRTTYKDLEHPIHFEITAEEDGYVYAYTRMLVTRGNAYPYSFFAGDSWRACSDCRNHYVVVGATNAGFSSAYKRLKFVEQLGPGKIMDCLYALTSEDKSNWSESFRYLCFVFIESIRSIEFGNHVRQTLVDASHVGNMHTYIVRTPSKLRDLPHYWGKASDALRGYFLGSPPRTHWSIANDVLVFFQQPVVEQGEGESSLTATGDKEVGSSSTVASTMTEQEKIRSEIRIFEASVRIVMHG